MRIEIDSYVDVRDFFLPTILTVLNKYGLTPIAFVVGLVHSWMDPASISAHLCAEPGRRHQ